MINPGSLAGQIPAGDDALIRRVQDLERIVRELQAQDVLKTAGIIAAPNQITVQGNEIVSGTLSVGGTATVSGKIVSSDWDGTDHSHLGSTGFVLGRDGTGPSYLALNGTDLAQTIASVADLVNNEIYPLVGYANNSGYALPAGQANRVTRGTVTFTVPSGYTRVVIIAACSDNALNSTASIDYLNSYLDIASGARPAYASSASVPAGYYAAAGVQQITTLTGLTGGGTFTVRSQPYAQNAAWAASASNATSFVAAAFFMH